MSFQFTLAVVGVQYANADKSNRRFEVELCRPGDPVELRAEPRNKLDRRAIGVWRAGGGQMGYVPAERAAWIGRLLERDEAEAVFQAAGGSVAYIRVRFGGGAPTMPDPTIDEAPGDDLSDDEWFEPDPEGPEFGA